jgi:hypothetical protein
MAISKSDWEKMVRKADLKARQQEIQEKKALRRFVDILKVKLPFELMLGITAMFLLYSFFGPGQLFKTLLNWIIGITMASTIVTFMIDRYKKLLHLNK